MSLFLSSSSRLPLIFLSSSSLLAPPQDHYKIAGKQAYGLIKGWGAQQYGDEGGAPAPPINVLTMIQDALTMGNGVPCPLCNVVGSKNGGCTHVTCGGGGPAGDHKGFKYCYFCGGARQDPGGRPYHPDVGEKVCASSVVYPANPDTRELDYADWACAYNTHAGMPNTIRHPRGSNQLDNYLCPNGQKFSDDAFVATVEFHILRTTRLLHHVYVTANQMKDGYLSTSMYVPPQTTH